MKRLINLLLSAVMILSAAIPSFAQDNTAGTVNATQFKPHWDGALTLQLGFPKGGMFTSMGGLMGTYYFAPSAFAGIGGEYRIIAYSKNSTDLECHYLGVPVMLGIHLGERGKFSLMPFAGADFDMAIAKKYKVGKEKKELKKGDFCITGKVGVSINFSDFSILGAYNLPLNDDMKYIVGKDGFFSVGVGFGF